jgi:hypothetical protein
MKSRLQLRYVFQDPFKSGYCYVARSGHHDRGP